MKFPNGRISRIDCIDEDMASGGERSTRDSQEIMLRRTIPGTKS